MATRPYFEATSHLVAHLLREINGFVISFMEPMVAPEKWPTPNEEGSQRKKIDACCDSLGCNREDDTRTAWHDFAGGLHRIAHRPGLAGARPIDPAFESRWDDAQVALKSVLARLESNFTLTFPLIDQLASGPPDMTRFRKQVAHSPVALDRFFLRAGREWLPALRADGYFDSPPPPSADATGSLMYPRWPQGAFLSRVAETDPVDVMDVARAVDTSNPEAHEMLIDAACAVPPALAVRLVPTVQKWLQEPTLWLLPTKAASLVRHLAAGREALAALALFDSLLAHARSRSDTDLGPELVEQMAADLFPITGVDGVASIRDHLVEAIADDRYEKEDFSTIWRPNLASSRRRDLRDALTSGLIEGAVAVVRDGASTTEEIVRLLEVGETSIFWRIALDLTTASGDVAVGAQLLTSSALFFGAEFQVEYAALCQAQFHQLSAEDRDLIEDWIVSGPDSGLGDGQLGRWQRRMLERIPEPIPSSLKELRESFPVADADFDIGPAIPEVGWISDASPLDSNEIRTMETSDLLDWIVRWTPSGEWNEPSTDGLARLLQNAIADDPDRFASAANSFSGMQSNYVGALFSGLREATRHGRQFEWAPVLELATQLPDDPQVAGDSLLDPDEVSWAYVKRESLGLISDGFSGGAAMSPTLRAQAWTVIECHANSPQDPAEQAGELERFGPSIRAINSVRGVAVETAIHYGHWLVSLELETEGLPSELKILLDEILSVKSNFDDAVHSLFGRFFSILFACDRAWAIAKVGSIFPLADDEARWRAAWDAFLVHSTVPGGVFRALEPQFRKGIAELPTPRVSDATSGDANQALITHVMSLYLSGFAHLGPGEVLDDFYAVATVEQRQMAIESIGLGLSNTENGALPPEAIPRLMELLDSRIARVTAGADAAEVRAFAWWFASGQFDEEWALNVLNAILETGGSVEPAHVVVARLDEIKEGRLLECLLTLDRLIESPTTRWFVLGSRDHITSILESGLSEPGETSTLSRALVNRLVARGNADFQKLLS